VDFAYSAEQDALRALARSILTDHATPERLKALEASGAWFDDQAWQKLAEASLLGVAIPEKFGGSGLGLFELGLLLEEVGRAVAPVPVLPSLALGALTLAAFGSDAQQARWLPKVVSGESVLTAALAEPDARDPRTPATTATRAGGGWCLRGVKVCVPAGERADLVLVPAAVDGGAGVFLVDPTAPGVTRARQVTTNHEPHARFVLDGVVVGDGDTLASPGADGARAVAWLHERALAAYCAVQVGVCERALRMTASYTAERKQFDRAIASFQAVQQRAADAFIDLEAMRLSMQEALYLLERQDSAEQAVTIAKFWAAEGGQHVAVAAQHLHGGIGVDVDYPLHRYFLWAKHIELTLGAATEQLARLGAPLAG
jgi:hypothetical protein